MKLRIRSWATKETIRVEICPSSSLRDLKNLIAGRLTSESSSAALPISPDAVHFSLNRREDLPEETLETLGIASGDLVFYTVGVSGFSPPSSSPASPALAASLSSGGVGSIPRSRLQEEVTAVDSVVDGQERYESLHTQAIEKDFVAGDGSVSEKMELEDAPRQSAYSLPRFLKRIVEGVKGRENSSSDLDILVIAVHAVFLESGFVEHDSHGPLMVDGLSSKASTVSMSYTMAEFTNPNFSASVDKAELKILLLGKYADVYGYLDGDSDLHRLCLNASKFVPSIISCINSMAEEDEKRIFDLWRIVKDNLSFPLLINLCDRNGLPLPPCFIRLPTELKIRILELLPGADLARTACVNSELRFLSSNEDLWKQKFMAEFPNTEASGSRWKDKFASRWEDQRRRKILRADSSIIRYAVSPLRRRDRAQFPAPMPNVLGGDYDLFPALGNAYPSRSRQARSNIIRGHGFMPHCNLGGFNA